MSLEETIRNLVEHAYEKGWRDACSDHMAQHKDADYPIGRGKSRAVDEVLSDLDPNDLLALQRGSLTLSRQAGVA